MNQIINQTYQHKKGPPKMIKDLKYGQDAYLRQSLLDITQIQNLNKIFIGRKHHYHIPQVKPDSHNKLKQYPKNQDTELQFNQQQFVLSPQQNLQLIKKQRITNKMKDKLNQMFRQHQVRKYKLRKPVLHNMLQDFKSSFRIQDQPKFRQALKNSQKQLEHIKINSKKRISSQYVRTDNSLSRAKFLSITNSKPTLNKNYFPSFSDFVKGKYKVKQKPAVSINIEKIDNYLETMITEPPISQMVHKKSSKQDHLKYLNRGSQSNSPVISKTPTQSVTAINNDTQQTKQSFHCNRCDEESKQKPSNKNEPNILIPNRNIRKPVVRSKSAVNPNMSFNRSQQSSKRVISAMQTYYSVKKQKNQQCDTIVEYMKKDRPLTSHIRRKNYTVIGNQHIQDLDKYREKSEQERIKVLQKNYEFYLSLLKIFEHCKEEQIQGSLQILKRLKQFFQSQYILFKDDVERICELEEGIKRDFGIRIIRQNLIQYCKKDIHFNTQNQEQYEIL